MKIYDIDQAILACCDMETGEILDIDRLHELQMEREAKIENIACWYKQLSAEAEAIKAERNMLSERLKAKENQAENLKNYLSRIANGQKLETPRAKITWRKSESVNVFDDLAIGDEYAEIIQTRKIDKNAIKDAIKRGLIVNGAELVEKNNIQIK